MMTPDNSTLPPDRLDRYQEAQVQADEANARKAAADAAMSELTLTQARYKALVPDLTGVATNAVTDKSVGVAFSGLVTHAALNHAAEVIANRIAKALTSPGGGPQPVILVTSQTDLLTSDLLSTTVKAWLRQLVKFADQVLGLTEQQPRAWLELRIADQAPLLNIPDFGASFAENYLARPGGIAAGAVGLGPIGLAAAAAAAVPSIISLFSSTTTVKDHSEDITDLTTTTSVLAALAHELGDRCKLVHEDFRLAPPKSQILEAYRQLANRRAKLIFKQMRLQTIKNKTELGLLGADGVETDHAEEPGADEVGPTAREPGVAEGDRTARKIVAKVRPDPAYDAELSVISSAITSIDAFTTAVNVTAAGGRSPLAIASLNELLHEGGADGISYVLSVKVLGGRSEQYTKDRRVGFDTYTTLANVSVSFMLYDAYNQKIIKSGIEDGVSSVHGRLGKPLKGLIGPNATEAIKDPAADAPAANPSGQPPGPLKKLWRRLSWARPRDSIDGRSAG
jgi:hypothetical protein